MRIKRIQVQNFRNFQRLDVQVGRHVVIVGENAVGKSNLLFALRLVLDPTLPDSGRQLRLEDFWDGMESISADDRIEISVDISEFEDDDDQLSILAEHLIEPDPMVARLTYCFQPISSLNGDPACDADFEFYIYGGGRPDNRVGSEIRRRLPLEFWNALRDAEGDLANWRRSPLRPLLDRAASQLDVEQLKKLSQGITDATEVVAETQPVKHVSESLHKKLVELMGVTQATELALGFSPADAEKLIRSLRLFVDKGVRSISEASLGTANILYLALKSLDIDLQITEGNRYHTFLAIEEPEAHLHPHLQRRLFRSYLQSRSPEPNPPVTDTALHSHGATVILTTHSPHVASVTPANSFVVLRQKEGEEGKTSTEGVSTATLPLNDAETADIERYLDVTRGEALFCRGILFVEGDAEAFLVPVLSHLLKYDLDELGISVCSVAGTHFLPYLKFFGPEGLNLPFAVVTDMDPVEGKPALGINRVGQLLEYLCPDEFKNVDSPEELIELAEYNGIFLTEHTFEVALFLSGRRATYRKTVDELSRVKVAKQRAKQWRNSPEGFDPQRMLKDISTIGKGRFAQRWAYHIGKQSVTSCPDSVKAALKYVTGKL